MQASHTLTYLFTHTIYTHPWGANTNTKRPECYNTSAAEGMYLAAISLSLEESSLVVLYLEREGFGEISA